MLKNIYKILPDHAGRTNRFCLATLVATSGSTPQVPGSSAVFSEQGLLTGTLGGGILEGDAEKKAIESIRSGKYRLYEFLLDADINDKEGALCGGSATILIDPDPGMHIDCFRDMSRSLDKGKPGLMITIIRDKAASPILKSWQESDHLRPAELPGEWPGIEKTFTSCMKTGDCINLKNEDGDLLFSEPIFPVPKLYIAGAGHIGKALSHQGRLLDFEVTVIDDRAEFANSENIPDADHIIAKPIGEAMSEIPKSKDTYIVIVTRGHQDDADALKACISHDIPYIGMIGSRKKIRTLKEKFLMEGWSTREEFERVHAPIGIEIGSISVQEIALSISAQLVQVRAAIRRGKKREIIASVILAAGESRRMGESKMLLPFGNSTIIGTVISNALNAVSDHVRVVLGADADAIDESIAGLKVEKVINRDFRNGMLSSVQAGIRSLPAETTAVMILLGDQPMISAGIMDRVIERYKRSEKDIIIASVDGMRGHPMIFNAKYIPEILSYGREHSLRDLPGKHPGEVEELETGNPEILRDIDTPHDYKNEFNN
ncbi:MAG: XdhC family protein [Bacteroidales bacterium]|nr:XdhC family protein [Bacteroidales bacterium]